MASREKRGPAGPGRGSAKGATSAASTGTARTVVLASVAAVLAAAVGWSYAGRPSLTSASAWLPSTAGTGAGTGTALPPRAQFIDQASFNALPVVPPPSQFNGTTPFVPPGHTLASLHAKPFHVYDEAFVPLLGPDPTLTLIAKSDKNPLFHEAVVWSRGTDEMFFVQNAGAKDAGTGLAVSSIIQKISLAEAAAVSARRGSQTASDTDETDDFVTVTVVPSSPQVLNPNGATNFRGQLLFAGEVLINNYFGRQFSSLNDLAVHPHSRDVYFTDPSYGYLQDFRPAPGLRNQVYRWREATGALTVVADDFVLPNGITFSPDGAYAYVADTGMHHGFQGLKLSEPASIYRFDVRADGTFENRKTFAYVDSVVPDGVHCDTHGNVYAGCGDGIQVWNPSGTLLGKIFLGTTAANFQFAGAGRMVVCAETELYYVTLAAAGAYLESEL
ncbi:Six-bladed beta-propeller, TolB-like protein [Niveomyces insectorum RCEF 264]|uniref:Six-bladed beta-propeller, TolB-like protein n=1 Tax=Niveomyces insectorum RCEF 264 TaxID=1081102 RepID=A0A162JFR1_9HYPO|nr:Six-bladed beta-propeller, TolB-like protein [Niveomyces insectorum RCEF 264]